MHDRSIRHLVRVYKKALFLCGWNHTTKPSWSTLIYFSSWIDRPTFLVHIIFLCRVGITRPTVLVFLYLQSWNHSTDCPGSHFLSLQSGITQPTILVHLLFLCRVGITRLTVLVHLLFLCRVGITRPTVLVHLLFLCRVGITPLALLTMMPCLVFVWLAWYWHSANQ